MSFAPFRKMADLFEVAGLFLRLGATAFGGPVAHMALMEQEVVIKRGWVSRRGFSRDAGYRQPHPRAQPGGNGGLDRLSPRRLAGTFAGRHLLHPARCLIVSVIGWAYLKFGRLPPAEGMLYGIKPVIIAVLVQAIWNLGRAAIKTRLLAIVAAGATALSCFAASPLFGAFDPPACSWFWPRNVAAPPGPCPV